MIKSYHLEAVRYPDEPEAATVHLVDVLSEIAGERRRQIDMGYDAAHDDARTAFEQGEVLMRRIYAVVQAGTVPERRRRLIELAAVSTAFVQSIDRLAAPGEAGEVPEAKVVRPAVATAAGAALSMPVGVTPPLEMVAACREGIPAPEVVYGPTEKCRADCEFGYLCKETCLLQGQDLDSSMGG